MKYRYNRWLLVLAGVSVLFLSGCSGLSGLLNFTPERALINEILSNTAGAPGEVDPDTLQILQTQELADSVFVMARFEAQDARGRMECLFVYETIQTRTGWRSAGGGGGCGPVGQREEAISVGSGRSGGGSGVANSRVEGLVYEPKVREVEVVWDDGETQTVEVINGSYLVMRLGEHEFERITALGEGDEVLYRLEHPSVAPGKE